MRPLVAALRDPEIPRWTAIPSPYDEAEAREFLVSERAERRSGRSINLAIVDAGSGSLLGSCGLTRVDWIDRKAEIGYWVAAEARRGSVGTAAVRLVSRWALESLRLERIELFANPANEASGRLAERAGFVREGLLRSYRYRKGTREDLVLFSLLRSDLG